MYFVEYFSSRETFFYFMSVFLAFFYVINKWGANIVKVIWNLTRLCSWNCLICCVAAVHVNNMQKDEIHKRMVNVGKELSLSDKLKIVDDLCENKIDSIDFSGGDLLLRDDDIKLVQYAATKFPKECLSISIPGTRLNSDLANSLKNCISKIEFTLDNVEEDKDGSRPKGYVETVKNAIKVCKKEKIHVSVSTVIKRGNCSQRTLSRIYNFLLANDVKEWEILRYYQVGRATDIYALVPDETKLLSAIQYINKLIQENVIDISFQHSLENKINGIVKCNALSRSIGILADGVVTACAWGLGYNGSPIDEKFILGYMPKQELKSILSSEKAIQWNHSKFKNGKPVCQVEECIEKSILVDNEKVQKVL